MQTHGSKKLNLGCGTRYRSDWVNIDIAPVSTDVARVDIKSRLPFENASFDAVYHSHVLEHLSPDEGTQLIRECARILKPGGILRIAVPDLEEIVKTYLKKIERACEGKPGSDGEYKWIVLELLDQMVRDQSGGKMAKHLSSPVLTELPFILHRIGSEGSELREKLLSPSNAPANRRSFLIRLLSAVKSGAIFSRIRALLTERCLRLIGGKNALEAYRIGKFRTSGEVHLWMYDRFSLISLLRENGFTANQVRKAEESSIENFRGSGLEIQNGQIIKPDSLFVEGVREG
jgi:predicted SAM-dependent methyltransferase